MKKIGSARAGKGTRMQIEYSEDESRIRWEWHGEWNEADLDELIEAWDKAQKRGKWESNEYLYTTGQTRCSECKTEFYVDDLLNVGEGAQEYLPNYCPHCGARMDES